MLELFSSSSAERYVALRIVRLRLFLCRDFSYSDCEFQVERPQIGLGAARDFGRSRLRIEDQQRTHPCAHAGTDVVAAGNPKNGIHRPQMPQANIHDAHPDMITLHDRYLKPREIRVQTYSVRIES